MIRTTELEAAQKFSPGYFIREQMALRNWSPDDLATTMGITAQQLNEILQDLQPLTPDLAHQLAEVFKTSEPYWINLSNGYHFWKTGK